MKTGILTRCCAIGIAATFFFSCTNEEMAKPDQPIDNTDAASVNYEMSLENPTYSLSADAAGRLSAITGDASMAKAGSAGFDVTWDTATARLRELRFEAKRGKDEVEFKLKTDRQVDLKQIPAALGAIMIPKGTYQQVKVYAVAEGDKKDPAVRFKGFLTWDGKKIPMEIQLSGKISLAANGKDVVITDTGVNWKGSLKISMDLILTKLQIGDFTGSFANGKLFISVDVNGNLHDKVKGSLENSMSVEHHHN